MSKETCPSCGYPWDIPTTVRDEEERAYYNRNPCYWCGRDGDRCGKDPSKATP